jgi:hypothetical protein
MAAYSSCTRPTAAVDGAYWFAVDDLPTNITNTAPVAIRDAAAGSRGVFAEITPSRSV